MFNPITKHQVLTSENFFRLPKLFTVYRVREDDGETLYKVTSIYNKMSNDAKMLYTVLKNRVPLSVENNLIDENGSVYVIATLEEICEILNCSNNKATRIKRELIDYNLLQERRMGINKPNHLYIGNLSDESLQKTVVDRTRQNDESRIVKMTNQESSKRGIKNRQNDDQGILILSNTDISNIKINDDDEKKEKAFFEVWDYYEKNLSAKHERGQQDIVPQPEEFSQIEKLYLTYGKELLEEAIYRAIEKDGESGELDDPMLYILKILSNWKKMKISTVMEAQTLDPFMKRTPMASKIDTNAHHKERQRSPSKHVNPVPPWTKETTARPLTDTELEDFERFREQALKEM